MKKNFFKKLSFVMALAMIVTVIAPAASAFAATTPAITVAKKYLYLNETGKPSDYDFNVKNQVAGSKYAWSSNKEDVATVDPKTGVASAVSVGTATLTCKVTFKTGKTKNLTTTVKVRDNIETVKVENPVETLSVDAEKNYNSDFVTFSGSKDVTSSIIRWTVDDTTNASIVDTNGIFKAAKAGTYKVTAWAFQSKDKYEQWKVSKDQSLVLDSDETTVKVVAEIKSVTQVDLKTVKVEFTSAMDKVDTTNLTVGLLMSGTPVNQPIKAITASEDKKSFKVEMYNNFNTDASYRVAYTDMKAVDFKTATTNAADVKSMKIETTQAVASQATNVVVKLFNAAGVEITTATLLGRVELTNASTSGNVYFNTSVSPKQITMYTIGDTSTVKAVYHTYEYDTTTGTEKNTLTVEQTITCVSASSVTLGTLTAWSIKDTAPADNFASVNHMIAAGDNGKFLWAKALKTDGTTVLTNKATTGTNDNGNFWRFTSSDTTVLSVYNNGGRAQLFPIKAGTVTLVAEYSTDGFTTASVVGTVVITVSGGRTATTLNLDATQFTLSNAVTLSKTVNIDVDDQFGTDMTEADVSVTQLTNDSALSSTLVTSTVSGSSNAITFSGYGKAAGTYTYKINANGLSRVVIITVSAPKDANGNATSTASYYKLALDSTSYDLNIRTWDMNETATFRILGYAANGVATTVLTTVTPAAYTVKVLDPNGNDITGDTSKVVLGATSADVKLAIGRTGGVAATKLDKGTYTVKLYNGVTLVDVQTFVVKDTQLQAVPTLNTKFATSASTTVTAAINECFSVTLDNVPVTNLYVLKKDVFGAGSSIFVKTVRFMDTATGVTYEVAVNQDITLPSTNGVPNFTYNPASWATDDTQVN